MKKMSLIAFACLLAASALAQNKSFHDFTVLDIHKKKVDLSSYKGKKLLIVNVASKCGLTPQYFKLQELYDKYKADNFVILGFPCNDFMGQEPGTNEEIAQFCEREYSVTFPLMDKIAVKGSDKAAIYKWLTEKAENGVKDAEVSWNFQKFMIDEKGRLVDFAGPREDPFSPKIIDWIEGKTPAPAKIDPAKK